MRGNLLQPVPMLAVRFGRCRYQYLSQRSAL